MSVRQALRAATLALALATVPAHATQCGTQDYPFPFTDVAGVSDTFCKGIMQAFVLGVTRGSSPTTFSPNDNVSRLQMTTFLQRAFDQGQRRASRRAALERWWTPSSLASLPFVEIPGTVRFCASDGHYVYAATETSVMQIEAATGRITGTWPGMASARQVVVIDGVVLVSARTSPGRIYGFSSTEPPTTLALAADTLGDEPVGMAFDGARLWTANASGSVSIVTIADIPFPVTTVGAGFTSLVGALYDGSHVWVTDFGADRLHKLDANGAILQSVIVGNGPGRMVFDGVNLWVVNSLSNSLSVVVAATGAVAFTLTDVVPAGQATGIAFDGERILVTDQSANVVIYRAADASRMSTVYLADGATPFAACSDGMRLWVSAPGLNGGSMLRF